MRLNWKVRWSVVGSRIRTPIRSFPNHLRNSSLQFYCHYFLKEEGVTSMSVTGQTTRTFLTIGFSPGNGLCSTISNPSHHGDVT